MKRRVLTSLALAALPLLAGGAQPAALDQVRMIETEPVAPRVTDPPAATPPDLLRFTNSNQLDGHFAGLKPGPLVLWRRDDLAAPVEFKTDQIRQIVLRRGQPAKPLPGPSSVALINGDRLPGTLVALDATTVTIETAFAGNLTLPRDSVGMIAPNPTGGRILYAGPFSDEGWSITGQKETPDADASTPADKGPAWVHAGAAWYNRPDAAALRREVAMPDLAVVRFQLAWKSRLSLVLAFHADFQAPRKPPAEDESKLVQNGTPGLPQFFGNAYALNLYPNYVILNRCRLDAEGHPSIERVQAGGTNIRLPETGEAAVELRCNRLTGEISLYLNDEFAMQWTEPGAKDAPGYAGKGGGIGFLATGSQVRISDLLVAEWNGMPDSARSMQSEGQDIVLLANGTDRFAGEVTGFGQGALKLKSRYGEFQFPLGDIAEVRFARNRLAKTPPATAGLSRVRFHPLGSLSGTLEPGRDGHLTLVSPLAGKLDLDPDYAVMLDFKNANRFLDDWDPQF